MSVGTIELVLFVFVFILALGVHVIITLLGREKGHREGYRGFLVYGIPVCFAMGLILTPPDPLSMLLIAVPGSLVYGFFVVMWILRRTQANPPAPNG